MTNKISFTGRLVADAESRFIPSGEAICTFRVASDVGYGDKKITNWFNCQLWGTRAEKLVQYLTKGLPVTVFGTLQMREWENKEGVKQLSPDIRVDEIVMHGTKSAEQRDAPKQEYSTPNNYLNDDIPF
jgi:single-strand DNA-binding protein